jgi:hypothetical protein
LEGGEGKIFKPCKLLPLFLLPFVVYFSIKRKKGNRTTILPTFLATCEASFLATCEAENSTF